jgi:hypothetical protein
MIGLQRRSLERQDVVNLADVQIGRDPLQHRIKVRNLSARGLMGESALHVSSGTRLTIDLPEVGPVAGTVVWVQEPRFGVAFDDEVEPLA